MIKIILEQSFWLLLTVLWSAGVLYLTINTKEGKEDEL